MMFIQKELAKRRSACAQSLRSPKTLIHRLSFFFFFLVFQQLTWLTANPARREKRRYLEEVKHLERDPFTLNGNICITLFYFFFYHSGKCGGIGAGAPGTPAFYTSTCSGVFFFFNCAIYFCPFPVSERAKQPQVHYTVACV